MEWIKWGPVIDNVQEPERWDGIPAHDYVHAYIWKRAAQAGI